MNHQRIAPDYSFAALAAGLPAAWDHAVRLDAVPSPPSRQRRHHVLSEEMFAAVLARERKRADRYEEGFVLLLVESHTVPSRRIPACVRDAVLSAGLDAAVFGWHTPTTLGVILPETNGEQWRPVVRRALARRLDRGTLSRTSIRTYRFAPGHPEPTTDGGLGLRTAATSRGEAAPHGYWLKRPLDIAGSLALLLLLAPVYLVVAALVKLTSPGPVFFRQTRVGQGGQPFTMLKFRTMRVDADESLHHEFVTRFIRSSADLCRDARTIFKLTNDPRVTPIGRILRETSVDELPQFWNVLRGEMSLVGPRPPLPYEVEQYRPWHWHRVLDAKPGITGLWQVVGRSRTTFDEMVRLDLRYVRGCSLRTDLGILLATPGAVISKKGAG